MFEENKIYEFIVEKKISLSNNEEYFIINFNDVRKFLLPVKYYTNYNIKIGDKINCIVNKINCNGEIFFEPLHPIYKIGDKDYFLIYREEERQKRKTGTFYKVLLAKNQKCDKACVLEFENDILKKLPFYALCEIINFKKGEIILKIINL